MINRSAPEAPPTIALTRALSDRLVNDKGKTFPQQKTLGQTGRYPARANDPPTGNMAKLITLTNHRRAIDRFHNRAPVAAPADASAARESRSAADRTVPAVDLAKTSPLFEVPRGCFANADIFNN